MYVFAKESPEGPGWWEVRTHDGALEGGDAGGTEKEMVRGGGRQQRREGEGEKKGGDLVGDRDDRVDSERSRGGSLKRSLFEEDEG